jgi:hypothetical protein
MRRWRSICGVALSELREDSNQGILEQVLTIPKIAGKAAAKAQELGPMRRQFVDEFAPGADANPLVRKTCSPVPCYLPS